MKRIVISAVLMTGLAACADMSSRLAFDRQKAASQSSAAASGSAASAVTAAATSAAPPPEAARTAEALDTTTAAQRAAAAAPATSTSAALGMTVAALGSPSEPGLWLKTPLVAAKAQGRVTNPATGKSSAVTLLPLDGPKTAGSQLSLAAMRLIGASLTDLTEIEVSKDG